MIPFILDVLKGRPSGGKRGWRRAFASLVFVYQIYKKWGGKKGQVVYNEVLRPGEELNLSHLRITRRALEKQSRKAAKASKRQAVLDEKAVRAAKKSAKRERRDAKIAKRALRNA